MRVPLLLLLVGTLFAPEALADWFYPALKIRCDQASDELTILNASAYNEAGIRKPDERRGIYVPQRNRPDEKERRCKTKSTDFLVKIKPSFGNSEVDDTFEVAVIRNGKDVLKYTSMNSDSSGLEPNSYVISIVVPAAGEPIIQRSCQAKVHMGDLGSKCTGEEPNSPMERTR